MSMRIRLRLIIPIVIYLLGIQFFLTFLATPQIQEDRGDHDQPLAPSINDPQNNSRQLDIVGFWHIGKNYQASDETRDSFVMKQANEILGTYLFTDGLKTGEYTLTLNYVTREKLKNETKDYLNQNGMTELKPTVLEMQDDKEYFEFPSLSELHAFCKQPGNTHKIVFYLHSKTLDIVRYIYEDFLLGKQCLQCMHKPGKLACGPHYTDTSKFLWAHFAGNFWMTRCNYISLLNPPWYEEVLDEEEHADEINQPWNFQPPYGRYFAEYWMMNDQGERKDHLPYGRSEPLIRSSQICSNGMKRAAEVMESIEIPRWKLKGPDDNEERLKKKEVD